MKGGFQRRRPRDPVLFIDIMPRGVSAAITPPGQKGLAITSRALAISHLLRDLHPLLED